MGWSRSAAGRGAPTWSCPPETMVTASVNLISANLDPAPQRPDFAAAVVWRPWRPWRPRPGPPQLTPSDAAAIGGGARRLFEWARTPRGMRPPTRCSTPPWSASAATCTWRDLRERPQPGGVVRYPALGGPPIGAMTGLRDKPARAASLPLHEPIVRRSAAPSTSDARCPARRASPPSAILGHILRA